MDTELLIAHGNTHRSQHRPDLAIANYAQAFVQDPESVSAFNNYGNVLREMGFPERAQPFLEHAMRLDPTHETARFNLAVCFLLMGDYKRGWPAYEDRWNFEHLKGSLPNFSQPRWKGEDITGKTILVLGEQGLGDTIQFVRFCNNLCDIGVKKIVLAVAPTLVTLFGSSEKIEVVPNDQSPPDFDCWTPIMSIPGFLRITLDKLNSPLSYIGPNQSIVQQWSKRLGVKQKLRVGFSWSGRRDTWINEHKAVPFKYIADMVKRNPNYEWINLQADATDEEAAQLVDLGCATYPGTIATMADSAGLYACLDVIVSVDTAVSHLAAAMGKPTWIMLNHYGTDWRWLLKRNDSPWYPTARLFRQPALDDWASAIKQVEKHLDLFKI